jgi:hypothetical protein
MEQQCFGVAKNSAEVGAERQQHWTAAAEAGCKEGEVAQLAA